MLETVVRTRTNREIFSIPGATLWLTLHRISSSIGEAPRYLDREVLARDIERIKAYYNSVGFFDIAVDTTVTEYRPGRVRVTFEIDEGEPYIIRSVAYSGFPDFEDDRVLSRFYSRSRIARNEVNDTTFTVNRQYDVNMISKERTRIIEMMHRNGYASVQRDSVRTFIKQDQENPHEMDMLIRVRPGHIYKFGDLRITVNAPDASEGDVLADTLSGEPYTIEPFRLIQKRDKAARIRSNMLRNRVLFTPGEQFNQDIFMSTVNQFQNLDMLSVTQFSLTEGSGLPDYSKDYLPVFIQMQTLPRHQLRSDLFGMQRLGFGAGAGVSYVNNNLFRGAERLELGVRGSFEYVRGSTSILGSSEVLRNLEASMNYSFPKFWFPFSAFNNNPDFLNPRTTFRFSIAQINQINFDVRANVRFGLRYQADHGSTTRSTLDLLEVEWFDATASSEFIQTIRENVADSLQVDRILEDFRPQFNSVLRYTFRNNATHVVRRDEGFFLETSVELGGTLPYLTERFIIGRDDLQSSIPSFVPGRQDLRYSQFLKTSFDYRSYHPLSTNTIFAWRGFAGFAYPYGLNPEIPLNQRFFAGGANDIRGFDPLTLGPADVSPTEIPLNGGDIKLAGFLELRHMFSRNFINTNWVVALFTDVGNVWYGPRSRFDEGKFFFNQFYDQLAVGSGIGLRLDWEFVILRIDLAYQINDLGNNTANANWRPDRLHFGIGHSF